MIEEVLSKQERIEVRVAEARLANLTPIHPSKLSKDGVAGWTDLWSNRCQWLFDARISSGSWESGAYPFYGYE